jgi:hypothetical protein
MPWTLEDEERWNLRRCKGGCKRLLPLESFYLQSRSKILRTSVCKQCTIRKKRIRRAKAKLGNGANRETIRYYLSKPRKPGTKPGKTCPPHCACGRHTATRVAERTEEMIMGRNVIPKLNPQLFGEDLVDCQLRTLAMYVQANVRPLNVPLYKIALYTRDGLADLREMGTIKLRLDAWNEQAELAERRNDEREERAIRAECADSSSRELSRTGAS